jgi:hypothetical protein
MAFLTRLLRTLHTSFKRHIPQVLARLRPIRALITTLAFFCLLPRQTFFGGVFGAAHADVLFQKADITTRLRFINTLITMPPLFSIGHGHAFFSGIPLAFPAIIFKKEA